MDHINTWIPAAAFVLTGIGIIAKVSALVTRLDTLLGELTDRVVNLESHVFRKLPPKKRTRR